MYEDLILEQKKSVTEQKKPVTLEEQVETLKKELFLEKNLTKILLKKQTEWAQLVESLNPTIEVLGNKIKTLQNDLHLKNQELTNILQSLSGGIIVTDLYGKVLRFNRAAVAITGITESNALGAEVNDLLDQMILPDLKNDDAIDRISQNFNQQFIYNKPDGIDIIVDSSTTLMESDESEKQGIIINMNDITQLKKLEEEAERKNRLTAMGEIAMQVAHEIRNPLGSIELFVSMMKIDFSEDSNEMELVQHIISATKSMNHIISNLLEYTKPRPITLEELEINKILDEFLDFARFSAEQQSIQVKYDSSNEDFNIKGNKELIKQVCHNIFVNAYQAMLDGGILKISVKKYNESDPVILERLSNSFVQKEKSVSIIKVMFEDNGKGMSDEIRKRIFDPFYTTREMGTGLGLSIVYKTMASHGGTIEVSSVLKKGTKISLLFPEFKV